MTRFPATSHEMHMQNMEESRRAEIAERGRHNDLLTGLIRCPHPDCNQGYVPNPAQTDGYLDKLCPTCHGTGFVKEKLP